MSGMIPGVGVPHRRRMNHRVNSHLTESYLHGDRSNDSSTGLSETVLRARQRLEKKLSSCLEISPRSKNLNINTESKECEDVKRSLKFTSINTAFNESDKNVSSFCSCSIYMRTILHK